MTNYFKALLLICVAFLLWKCGESTDPEMPNALQTERLLGGDSMKTWKKVSILNKSTKDTFCIKPKNTITWKFLVKKDCVIVTRDSTCDINKQYSRLIYQIQLKGSKSYLKFYKGYTVRKDSSGKDTLVNVLSDTLRRQIKSITNNEFVTEYDSSGNLFEERFRVLE